MEIINTGSPVKVISSHLARKIKMAPDLNHSVVYGTAGMASTKSIGAHSALPLRFRNLFLTSPAVVLENEGYKLLIGIQLLMKFDGIVNTKKGLYRYKISCNSRPNQLLSHQRPL